MTGTHSLEPLQNTKNDEAAPFGFSGTALKIIALITMLLDHIGASLIENGLLHVYDLGYFSQIITTEWGMGWYMIDMVFRMIGRLAFPIFVFLLVEGFFHTHSRKNYVRNCFLFALLSELPFDLALANPLGFSGGASDQNVYFTLTIGLLMMMALEHFRKHIFIQAGIVLLSAWAAQLLHVDYDATGVLLIAVFYLFYRNYRMKFVLGGILMAVESLGLLGTAALALIPIARYNGKRGDGPLSYGKGKYLFYWFYPVHLAVLYSIAHFALGMGR